MKIEEILRDRQAGIQMTSVSDPPMHETKIYVEITRLKQFTGIFMILFIRLWISVAAFSMDHQDKDLAGDQGPVECRL